MIFFVSLGMCPLRYVYRHRESSTFDRRCNVKSCGGRNALSMDANGSVPSLNTQAAGHTKKTKVEYHQGEQD